VRVRVVVGVVVRRPAEPRKLPLVPCSGSSTWMLEAYQGRASAAKPTPTTLHGPSLKLHACPEHRAASECQGHTMQTSARIAGPLMCQSSSP
jgi:hypothetical protein